MRKHGMAPFRGGRCRPIVAALVGFMVANLQAPTSSAQTLDDELSTCTTENCQAMVVGGTINKHTWDLSGGSTTTFPRTGAGSWVMPVRAGLSECLRLDILVQSTTMEMVVVSPSGVIWRNEGRGGTAKCPSCPLVKIDGTNQSGYYIVQINHRTGAPLDAFFKLAYGRYSRPNANCANPTSPLN